MVNLTSTEEENTEFLKTLWDKYKYLAISAVFIVILTIVGIERSSSNKNIFNQETSELYSDFVQSLDSVDIDSIQKGNDFMSSYPDSVYSRLIALQLAKLYYEEGDKDEATDKLNWIIENTNKGFRQKYDPIEVTAKYRLALLFLDQEKFKESLDLLETIEDKTASIYELIGDCYVYLEANDNARINYLKAMEASPSESVKSIIKMKLSDIN